MGKKLSALKRELMNDEEFKKEYESLEQEFKFVGRMIEARLQARLSQEQVASRMGTTQSVVARIESGRPLPSLPRSCFTQLLSGARLRLRYQRQHNSSMRNQEAPPRLYLSHAPAWEDNL